MTQQYRNVLCFDFDGTMFESDSTSEYLTLLARVLEDLKKGGSAVIINTGRSIKQIYPVLVECKIDDLPDFIIVQEGEIFSSGSYDRNLFNTWNRERSECLNRLNLEARKFFECVQFWLSELFPSSEWLETKTTLPSIRCKNHAEMNDVCNWVDEHLLIHGFENLRYQRNSIFLRFTHALYSKGSALRHLAEKISVRAMDSFVIGDDYNDLSMLNLHVAHRLACPANAIRNVKAQVTNLGGYVSIHNSTLACLDSLVHFQIVNGIDFEYFKSLKPLTGNEPGNPIIAAFLGNTDSELSGSARSRKYFHST